MNRKAFVHTVKAKDPGCFEVATLIEILMRSECALRHQRTRHSTEFRSDGWCSQQRLDHQPLPYQPWFALAAIRIPIQFFGENSPNGHDSQKPDSLHPFSHCWHQLCRKLIGDQVQAERIERTFAACLWIERR